MSIKHPTPSSLDAPPIGLDDVRLVKAKQFSDPRGWFCEIYTDEMTKAGGALEHLRFVQDNASLSKRIGTVRGLHYQAVPHAQDKLLAVMAGAIFDVAVDIRKSSPTFGLHVSFELRAGTGDLLIIPAGFAHGFMTLEPDSVVFYKVSSPYAPEYDRGILWNDPELGIAWPSAGTEVSQRDARLPPLRAAVDLFE